MFYSCHLVVQYCTVLCSCRATGGYEVTNTVASATVSVVTAAVACTARVGLVPYYTTRTPTITTLYTVVLSLYCSQQRRVTAPRMSCILQQLIATSSSHLQLPSRDAAVVTSLLHD